MTRMEGRSGKGGTGGGTRLSMTRTVAALGLLLGPALGPPDIWADRLSYVVSRSRVINSQAPRTPQLDERNSGFQDARIRRRRGRTRGFGRAVAHARRHPCQRRLSG